MGIKSVARLNLSIEGAARMKDSAPVGVRGVPDAGAEGAISMAESRVRVPADRARRRRDGVLGRERARGHGCGVGGALTGVEAGVVAEPAGRDGN